MANELDRAIAEIAEAHHGVFSAAHLRDLHVSERERTHRLATGRWIAVHERVYRVAGTPTSWRSELMAACWAGGTRGVASHRSAAALHGLPGGREDPPEITCPRSRRARHDGVLVHESRALGDRDVTVEDAIPVTTVERTIFDLCAVVGRRTVDLAIDNALRRDLTTLDQLVRMLRRVGSRGRKGTVVLRELLLDRAPGALSESEQERLLLTMLRRSGLPTPDRQVTIHDTAGQFVARVDLAYPSQRVAIEYDSYQEHVGKVALVRDSRRRNALSALGWTVIVATAEDLKRGKGGALVSAIRRALATSIQPASN